MVPFAQCPRCGHQTCDTRLQPQTYPPLRHIQLFSLGSNSNCRHCTGFLNCPEQTRPIFPKCSNTKHLQAYRSCLHRTHHKWEAYQPEQQELYQKSWSPLQPGRYPEFHSGRNWKNGGATMVWNCLTSLPMNC